MPLSITEDIKSVSELKLRTNDIFTHVHETGRPVVITVNGKPDVVIIDVNVFERNLKSLNMGLLLDEAKSDIKKGRVRPARNFLKELKKRAKT